MSDGTASRGQAIRRPSPGAAALAAGAAALLLALRAAEQSPDALDYAYAARGGHDLFHPHHLLFAPLVRLVLAALAPLGRGGDAILAGQIHNVAWAVAALLAARALVRRAGGSPALASGAALFLLVTRGFWVYATQVEVYVPALACLAVTALLASGPAAGAAGVVTGAREAPPLGTRRAAAAALALALAVLYHQTSALFAAPLAALCVARRGRAGWREAAAIAGGAGALALLAYAAAYAGIGGPRTAEAFARWALSYGFAPVPAWGSAGHFGPDGVAALLRSQAANFAGVPERWAPAVAPLFGLTLLALAAWNAAALTRRGGAATGRRGSAGDSADDSAGHGAGDGVGDSPGAARLSVADTAGPLRWCALIWLGVHFAFFLWWLPTDTDFFVVSLLPLVLLGALAAGDVTGRGRCAAGSAGAPGAARAVGVLGALAIAVLAAGNLAATVLPLRASRGADFAAAARLHALAPPGCAVGTRFGVRENLRYHFERAAVDLDLPRLAAQAGRESGAGAVGPAAVGPSAAVAPAGDCLLVPVSLLRPERAAGGRDGHDDPAAWLAWLSWVLEVERDGSGAPASCREIVLTGGDAAAEPCALIGPGRTAVAGLDGLAALLDARLGAPGDAPWSLWLRRARAGGARF